jgi:tetratricopeptide (TPR) repeat protein
MWKWLTILLLLSPAPPSSCPGAIASRPRLDEIISCTLPVPSTILPAADGRFAPVFPGWGHHHYSVTTTDDSAQFYFDQGLNLYYSYHLPESAASFKEAEQKDSRCAMAYWGEALAMGPYYNNVYVYKMPAGILPVLDRMNTLASAASNKEKDLIAALDHRYSTDTADSRRAELNTAYAQATKALISKYPGDNDIKALYIDGVMDEHAWDMWDAHGNPRSWTPELIGFCEAILKKDPDHPAALHYHIHLLEASFHPETALASADRLKDLMPGVPHMVHMASHSYQRTGNYEKGVTINDSASAAQRNYAGLAPQLHLITDNVHYDAVEAFCAMNGGMFDKAIGPALKCRAIAASRPGVISTNLQYLSMMPEFAMVRMGKWQSILEQPVPDSRRVYATVISLFARGMAYVRTGDTASARHCLDRLKEDLKDPVLREHHPPFNDPVKGASVAEGILEGEILYAEKQTKAAIAAFQRAIDWEDRLTYLEPNDWPLPARQFAANCLLTLGQPGPADRLFREDLIQNPGNGWSLMGLSRMFEIARMHARSKPKPPSDSADYYGARAKAAFAHADQIPPSSVY